MTALWLALLAASWLSFGGGVVYLATTTRRIHPDAALLVRAVLTLLIMAGVIFLFLASNS